MEFSKDNPELYKRLKNLFDNMRDSRKLFRLLKSIHEINKIRKLINNPPSD